MSYTPTIYRHHGGILIAILALLVAGLWVANLFVGSVSIPSAEVWNILWGGNASVESWQ